MKCFPNENKLYYYIIWILSSRKFQRIKHSGWRTVIHFFLFLPQSNFPLSPNLISLGWDPSTILKHTPSYMYTHTTKYKASEQIFTQMYTFSYSLHRNLFLKKKIELIYTSYMSMGSWMFHKGSEPDIGLPTNVILFKHKINSTGLLLMTRVS